MKLKQIAEEIAEIISAMPEAADLEAVDSGYDPIKSVYVCEGDDGPLGICFDRLTMDELDQEAAEVAELTGE